jgi:integrase
MSFVDLVHLRKSDLKGNYITYHRRKSGSLVTVKVLPPARALLGLFLSRDKDSPYLLSILGEDTLYRSLLRRFNRHLNTLGDMLGLEESLTSYVARHTWATSAYHIGVPTAVIGQAMGHRTENVTSTYLASFNTETVDDANRMVWESMFGNKTKNTKNVSLLGRERHDSVANVKRTFRKRNPPAF